MLTSTHPAAGDICWDNSWTAHFRGSVILGVPFVAAQIAQLAINTTDVVMVGRLGATELASIIIATQMFFTIFVFGSGFSNAVVPMVARPSDVVTSFPRGVRCAWACGPC